MPSPKSESYAPRRRGRRSASLGAGGSLRCWASLANRSAFSRAVFFRVATASASYSIIAFRPSRARSSCLNRFSACCRACSEFTMNVSGASNVPQTPHCDVRQFNIQDICTYRREKRPAHLIEVRCRICCTSGLLGKDRSHGNAEEDINELYGGLRAFLFPVGAISRAASASLSLSISPRESSSITLVKISVTYSPTFSARASSPPGDQLTGKNILLTCRNRHPPRDWEGAGCRGRLTGELLIRVRYVRGIWASQRRALIGVRLARTQGTAAFGFGGNAASVVVPCRRSSASLSARSSFSSGGT